MNRPMGVNVDGQAVQAGRRGATAGFLGVDASRALYCGLHKSECQCGTCDGRCGPEDGCPCVACQVALLRRDSSVGTNVDNRPVFRGTDPKSIYCGHLAGACKCGTCDGRCGPSNGCPCDACVAYVLGQRASVRNDLSAPAWKGDSGMGGFLNMPATQLFYCGRLVNECRCGRCDGRCGPSNGCPCSSCLVLYRLSSAPVLKNLDGVSVWLGSKGQAGDAGLAASSMYYCGRRGVKQCGCGKCPDQRCGPTDGCPCNACLAMVSISNARVVKSILKTRESSMGFHALTHKILFAAISRDRCDIVDAVLSVSAFNVNSMTSDGLPLLCAAVKSGRVKIVERLLAAGAMPDLKCRSGETPLYLSISLGQYNVVDLLLKNKADPNLACTTGQSLFNSIAIRTLTPLHVAAIENHEQIVRQLIMAGANPTLRCSLSKMPCEWAKPSSELGVFLAQYTQMYIFDEAVSKILSQGFATLQELEHLSSLITNVYDLRVVYSIGNAMYVSQALRHVELDRILSKAFERAIVGKLIESHRSAGFFCMILDYCARSRLITKAEYTNYKSNAYGYLLSQHDFEQTMKIRNEIHQIQWQLSMNEERLPKVQTQIKQVISAYQNLQQCRLTFCEGMELNQAKQKCALKLIAVARVFVYDCFDHGIDLASPVELLGATVNSGSVDTFMDSDWSEVVLTSEAVAVLERASVKSSEFIAMLRAAIISTDQVWSVDGLSNPTASFSISKAKPRQPAILSEILLEITKVRMREVSVNELDEIFAASASASEPQGTVDQHVPAPLSSTRESAELVFLEDIDRLLYHSAIQCSNGHLSEFRDMVREIEMDEDERNINELADVQYSDGTCGHLSPLEYACHLGYADIVKYLLDREDVVKTMRRGSYFIKAKRRQQLLDGVTAAKEHEPATNIDFSKRAWG